jgi:hypothetical protein
VSEKQLDRSQIPCLAVDLRRLGAAHRMRAVGAAVHPRAHARVLARGHMRLIVDSAREEVGALICAARFQPVLQRGAGLFRDLELDRTAGLVLDNRRPVSHVTAYGDVIDPKADEIATPKLAVDGKVEHRQIAFAVLDLKSDANGPDLFRPEGRFWPTRRPLFHATREEALFVLISVDMVDLHARPLHRSALVQRAGHCIATAQSRGGNASTDRLGA